MPVTPTYPGVYIEEVPSGVHTITGVSTSITAFIGRAWKGPMDKATMIFSYADYHRIFGGLWRPSTMSYAVKQFFSNGGSQAIIVRVATRTGGTAAAAATLDLATGTNLVAASEGTWGRNLIVTVDHDVRSGPDSATLFNLTILDDPDTVEDGSNRGGSGAFEKFLNVSIDENNPRYVAKILDQKSALVRIAKDGGGDDIIGAAIPDEVANSAFEITSGHDGDAIEDSDVQGDPGNKTGINALEEVDLFNILCIPPLTPGESGTDVLMATLTAAALMCKKKRAFLIVDAPNAWTGTNAIADAFAGIGTYGSIEREYSGIFFPRIRCSDPLQDGNLEYFAPCGAIAGIMSRIDSSRGVWKAAAGLEAGLKGVSGLSVDMTDPENGRLNPVGINCLRLFRGVGIVNWGGRTLAGQDILASEWKYIPVRRLALFLEESLFRGTKWVVFEPNDEPLWAKIRMNLGAFMMRLFRQGAFQGSTPDKAFYVKCDAETTPQSDRDLGIVNIEVGFAPLKPAEFVIIKIQQIAGDLS